ncbi:MAG: hypothetical protein IIC18_05475 [Bacteroidetes bacterium]|nr:hypothetical protein [Bacteroidota bacterium]
MYTSDSSIGGNFGRSVSVSGIRPLAGAEFKGDSLGATYVFEITLAINCTPESLLAVILTCGGSYI